MRAQSVRAFYSFLSYPPPPFPLATSANSLSSEVEKEVEGYVGRNRFDALLPALRAGALGTRVDLTNSHFGPERAKRLADALAGDEAVTELRIRGETRPIATCFSYYLFTS